MRYLYSAAYYALFPFVLLRTLLRSRRAPAYRRRLAERFGLFLNALDGPALVGDSGTARVIWVHAVSVGEVLAAAPVIEDLLLDHPQYRLLITTTTPTGSERVRALFGERVLHVYCPWDLPGSVRRFLDRARPQLLLIMETELWPNLLHYTAARGCGILLVNARLSERSARGYARLGGLCRQMLGCLDQVACQGEADAQRFLRLGLASSRVQVTGNIKFDLALDAHRLQSAAQLRQSYGAGKRPIIVAASTHATEEAQILAAFTSVRQSAGDCLLLLAPRHPERFDEVYRLAAGQGWHVSRLSDGNHPAQEGDIVLCDTMGELAQLFCVATVAVIGGSLVEHGGHNPLEAAVWGVPVISGPHMFNFSSVCDLLLEAGAMEMLRDPGSLASCLLRLLSDPAGRHAMGEAGRGVMESNRGAGKRVSRLVSRQLERA